MLSELKKLFLSYDIDGYLIPKNDEFFAEYSYPDRLKAITKFSGSAGLAIILMKENYLWHNVRHQHPRRKNSQHDTDP